MNYRCEIEGLHNLAVLQLQIAQLLKEGRDKSSDATLYIAIGGVILVIAVGLLIATRKKKKHTQVRVDENK